MKASIEFLGRGLLVLALGGYAIGCGDDSGGSKPVKDGGADSGPSGGTGGVADKDGGSGGTGGGTSSTCLATAKKNSSGGASAAPSDACLTCACGKDDKAITACTPDCWALIDCAVKMCPDDSDMTKYITCLSTMCDPKMMLQAIGALSSPAGMALAMCPDECGTVAVPDGGTDAGN
jgi:hypothetical protein